MRAMGLLMIALTGGGAQAAQAAASDSTLAALNQAAFVQPQAPGANPNSTRFKPHFRQGEGPAPIAATGSQTPLATDKLFSSRAWALGGGTDDGVTDTVSMTVGTQTRGPAGIVLAVPTGRLEPETSSVNLDYRRAIPSALSISGGRYAVDLAPHAGLAMSGAGGSALAGAEVRLQLPQSRSTSIAGGLGFAPDRAAASSRGRWFLFAESSGELVGVHLTRSGGLMPRANMTVDDGVEPTVVSDSQAGLGWRKGDMQASFGYVHREIKNDMAFDNQRQIGDIKGDMVAFTFSLRSH
jgi:hypothetical protein